MTSTTTTSPTRPCGYPCPYEAQHQLGAALCAYEANGIVKKGCEDEIVFQGPSQALRLLGFAQVARLTGNANSDEDGATIVFFRRRRLSARLTIWSTGIWKVQIRTISGRPSGAVVETAGQSEYAALRQLVTAVAR